MAKQMKRSSLFMSVKKMIEHSKKQVSITVNAELTSLYWNIGTRINQDILNNNRAEYGKQVVEKLAFQLTEQYGKGWGEKQLRQCMQFATAFPDEKILYALRIELTWTHIRSLIYMEDPLKQAFYIEMCRVENWSSRQLQDRIQSMLYERTGISKKPKETIKKDLDSLKKEQQVNPDLIFRDPYILDFLGLKDTYSEKDIEVSIITQLQHFITEIGSDFAFVGRQKRITIDRRDYYIDLLFFHRRLKCLVAIDLKIGVFEAGYKGQMELYLKYLEKHEKREGEQTPIGLILCTGKNKEHIELLQLDKSNIKIAEYLTALPPKQLLRKKLQQAVAVARQAHPPKKEINAKSAQPRSRPSKNGRKGSMGKK
jgi:predicted nuclease of restriction endonuclease-like (RecB) superfamily